MLQPEHYIHPQTRILAEAMRAADTYGGFFWPAELLALLGRDADLAAAYALLGRLPCDDYGNPYPHYSEAAHAIIDVEATQLVAATLMLAADACKLPPLLCSRKRTEINLHRLRQELSYGTPVTPSLFGLKADCESATIAA